MCLFVAIVLRASEAPDNANFVFSEFIHPGLRKQHSSKSAHGVAPAIQEALAKAPLHHKSHDLMLFSVAGLLGLLCMSCGAVTTARVKHLSLSCLGYKTARGQDAIRRFARGQHPDPKHIKYYGHDSIDGFWHIDNTGAISDAQ